MSNLIDKHTPQCSKCVHYPICVLKETYVKIDSQIQDAIHKANVPPLDEIPFDGALSCCFYLERPYNTLRKEIRDEES